MVREEIFSILESSDIFEKLERIDFESKDVGLLVILSFFKDVGWVNYITKVIDRKKVERIVADEMEKFGFKPICVRSTGALDVIIVGEFEKNFKIQEFLDKAEIAMERLITSNEILGEVRKFADIFENPFKDTFEMAVGFSKVKSGKREDLESSVRIAVRNMELRKVDRLTKLSLELIRIIEDEKLESYFQPIVDVEKKKIFAYEALARGPKGSPLRSPYMLFKVALLNGLDFQLDSILRKLHLKRFKELGLTGKIISLNLSSSTSVLIDEFMKEMKQLGFSKDQIMLEISEKIAVDDYNAFGRFLDLLVREGFKVAVDDFGSSAMTFKLAWAIESSVIKLDKSVVEDMLSSSESLDILSRTLKCFYKGDNTIVAEGVENEEELFKVIDLGYSVVQGYVLAKPSLVPPTDEEIKDLIEKALN